MRVTPLGVEGCCALGPPRISLDSPTPYQKAPPKLWVLLSDGSHRSYIIWWGISLMAPGTLGRGNVADWRQTELRRMPPGGVKTLLLAPSTTTARVSSSPSVAGAAAARGSIHRST
jgi:hypothetical protein